jgi:preprotein translocase subunit SecB
VENKFIPHPIQIESVDVVELYIKMNEPAYKDLVVNLNQMSFTVARTEYDIENKVIMVGLICELEDTEEISLPFNLRVELFGIFSVNEEKFDIPNINDWAERNAPFILYPYLREQIYSLTMRCGISPINIPLVEVPTFKKKCRRIRRIMTDK